MDSELINSLKFAQHWKENLEAVLYYFVLLAIFTDLLVVFFKKKIRGANVIQLIRLLSISGVDPFNATGFFLYPLKTSENLWYSNVYRGYRKRPVA